MLCLVKTLPLIVLVFVHAFKCTRIETTSTDCRKTSKSRLRICPFPNVKCLIVFVAFSDKNYIYSPAEFCMHTKSPHPWIQEPKLAAKSRKQKVGHFDLTHNLIPHFETKTLTMTLKLPTSLMTTSYTSSLGFSTNIFAS